MTHKIRKNLEIACFEVPLVVFDAKKFNFFFSCNVYFYFLVIKALDSDRYSALKCWIQIRIKLIPYGSETLHYSLDNVVNCYQLLVINALDPDRHSG